MMRVLLQQPPSPHTTAKLRTGQALQRESVHGSKKIIVMIQLHLSHLFRLLCLGVLS